MPATPMPATTTPSILSRLLRRAAGGSEPSESRASESKASRAPLDPSPRGTLGASWLGAAPARWGASGEVARAGLRSNAVVHRCVRLVAGAAAGVPLLLHRGDDELTEHPLLALLARPSARRSGPGFLEALHTHLVVSGEAFVEAVSLDGRPRELHLLRPERVAVLTGPDGWPAAYEHALGQRRTRYPAEAPPGEALAPLLHLALFDPFDDHRGLAPLAAAAQAIEQHAAASAWNKALLDNAARPSGALVHAGPGLTDPQFARLKDELEAGYAGALNAGRPLLLEGGLDWRPLSLSPKDMDFAEGRAAAARDIALAFGVPPALLGLPGDNTYANYAEANRAFLRQTIVPLAARVAADLAAWLGPAFDDGGGAPLRLEPDLDRVEGLAPEREALWRRVNEATFLDRAEKREAVGYGRRTLREPGAPREPEAVAAPRDAAP